MDAGYVHIDTYCAMSGISRFVEERDSRRWRYSKQEDLPPREYAVFDYLLVGVDDLARMKQNQSYAGVFDRFEEVCPVLLISLPHTHTHTQHTTQHTSHTVLFL
jgi:hypothetical protein